MKRTAIGLLFVLPVGSALADDLQFTFGNSGAYASYAEVRVMDAASNEVFRGTTDQYGRVSVPLTPGMYQAVVNVMDHSVTVSVQITGGNSLRQVTL